MTNPSSYSKAFNVKGDYVLGKSSAETERLVAQAAIIRPITQRLLSQAGLQPGMRILDVGCGAGDVSLLASEMVGPKGSLVGIDHNASVLVTAQERADAAGYRNVEFREHSAASFNDPDGFDLVVGRYVLLHQDNPALFLRHLRTFVRPGGALALHEISTLPGEFSTPPIQLYEDMMNAIAGAFRAVAPHYDAPHHFVSYFHEAGLPEPALFSETPVSGGTHAPFFGWAADLFRSLHPVIEKHELWPHGPMPGDDAETELRKASMSLYSQVRYPQQICAWAQL